MASFWNRSQFFLNIKCHNGYFWECMLPHTKRQVKFHKMHCFTMFITALCIVFLIKLRWPKDKSLCDIVLTSLSSSLHLTVGEIPGRAKATPETYSFVISSWLDLVMFGRKRPRPSSFGGEAKNCSISPNFLLALFKVNCFEMLIFGELCATKIVRRLTGGIGSPQSGGIKTIFPQIWSSDSCPISFITFLRARQEKVDAVICKY